MTDFSRRRSIFIRGGESRFMNTFAKVTSPAPAARQKINIPYICSPERATELGRPLLSFALSGLGSVVGAFPVVPHYAVLRALPLATLCRAAGAGLVDSAKASKAYRAP